MGPEQKQKVMIKKRVYQTFWLLIEVSLYE